MTPQIREFPIENAWCVHSYYTLCPYAPDSSGRILAATADLKKGTGDVVILSAEGELLDRFGEHALDGGFYHTGWWQTWSPDARHVYYQAGSLKEPAIGRRDLTTGETLLLQGDMEGAPPHGEPILSGFLGMLYAAGYGDGTYRPELAPVPFQERDRHGIYEYGFAPTRHALRISVNELLKMHPRREELLTSDASVRTRLGSGEGLTLMAYCVRWSPDGSRLLFYFGNHCVAKKREEPKIAYVMTADRALKNLSVAVDLSYGRPGVHWSWQPDNEHLIGYGPHPDYPNRSCLAEVRYDGSEYRMLSEHASGGHPSVSPRNHDLIVTDERTATGGAVLFLSRSNGKEIARAPLSKFVGSSEPPGRNALRICHHPVFNRTGDRVLCNSLPQGRSTLAEIRVDGL